MTFPQLECDQTLANTWPDVLKQEGIKVVALEPLKARYEKACKAEMKVDIPPPTQKELETSNAVKCSREIGAVKVFGCFHEDENRYLISFFFAGPVKESRELEKEIYQILISHGAKPFDPWEDD